MRTSVILKSSLTSLMKLPMLFISRSTFASTPVLSSVVIASVAMLQYQEHSSGSIAGRDSPAIAVVKQVLERDRARCDHQRHALHKLRNDSGTQAHERGQQRLQRRKPLP